MSSTATMPGQEELKHEIYLQRLTWGVGGVVGGGNLGSGGWWWVGLNRGSAVSDLGSGMDG